MEQIARPFRLNTHGNTHPKSCKCHSGWFLHPRNIVTLISKVVLCGTRSPIKLTGEDRACCIHRHKLWYRSTSCGEGDKSDIRHIWTASNRQEIADLHTNEYPILDWRSRPAGCKNARGFGALAGGVNGLPGHIPPACCVVVP